MSQLHILDSPKDTVFCTYDYKHKKLKITIYLGRGIPESYSEFIDESEQYP